MGVMGATSRSVHFGAERDAPPQKRPTRGKVVGKPLPSWKGFSLWQKPVKRHDVVTFCPYPELVAQLRARSFPCLTRRLPPGERNLRLPIRRDPEHAAGCHRARHLKRHTGSPADAASSARRRSTSPRVIRSPAASACRKTSTATIGLNPCVIRGAVRRTAIQ